ncbi:MAG TPA: acetylornithine transaminase [Armatimonadetes bacterium]|nr:acetylornithine transaminase [Armatimonadota bacterium]
MTLEGIKALSDRYVMNTYGRLPVAFVRGEGAYLWDTEGKRYLDFLCGIAVTVLGHCHPKVSEAIAQQARTLMHTSNLYYIAPQAELAQKLADCSVFDRVFFCNSGAEANEAALKLARRYGHEFLDGRYEIITMENSFHGRTLATLTATGQTKYQKGFAPLLEGFKYVPFNDLEAVRAAITEETCAILVEPIQGEGGVNLPADDYLPGLRQLCHEQGLLLIVDEVQTGLGRTGKMFAYQHSDIRPDIMTLAKGLGNGFPIGAMLATEEVARGFEPGTHASTFGGNFTACTAALAVLEVIAEENLVENAAQVGAYFRERLNRLQAKHENIVDVRGKGVMNAIQLSAPQARAVQDACRERGLIVNAIGDHIVRFHPPLNVQREQVDEAVSILDAALAEQTGK